MNRLSHRFNNTRKQEENAGLRPWSNQKCEASSRKFTSLHERPQPSLSQLPLLPQERGKVVHGGERLWVIRTEVRFAPCKSSAVKGLRLASRDGTGGVGPQAWICLRVPCGKGRKVGNGLEFGLMKKMSSTIIPCKCTRNSKLEE